MRLRRSLIWPKSVDRIPPIVLALRAGSGRPHQDAPPGGNFGYTDRLSPHLGVWLVSVTAPSRYPLGEAKSDAKGGFWGAIGRANEGDPAMARAPVLEGVYGHQILAKSGNKRAAFWPKSSVR